jgi:hypothetical protein
LASLHDYTGCRQPRRGSKVVGNGADVMERETLPVFARDTETAIFSAVLKETAVNLKSHSSVCASNETKFAAGGRDDSEDDDKVNALFLFVSRAVIISLWRRC